MKKNRKQCSWFDELAQLIIALTVPIGIAVYTIVQNNNESFIAQENRRQDFEIANKTRLNDIAMANDQQKEDILTNYLDFLGKLIEKYGLQLNESQSVRSVIRFRTISALKMLDSKRENCLFRSLYDTGLIIIQNAKTPLLIGADLSELDLGSFSDGPNWLAHFPSMDLKREK